MVATKKVARPAEDPDIIPHDPGIEIWKNVTAGMIHITRVGDYGKQTSELVEGGRSFNITPHERRMNQSLSARPDMDIFTNGTLQPQTLIDGEHDTVRLRDNPNIIADRDIPKLFRLRGEAFAERVATITNAATIGRLVELAREPRFNVTVQQYEMLRRHERTLAGNDEVVAPAPTGAPGTPKAVTPR